MPKSTVHRRRVNSPRNSTCGSARLLAKLDWSNWFTDTTRHGQVTILHVAGPDDAWHRVFCRHADKPRLWLLDGVLYWLIDEEA